FGAMAASGGLAFLAGAGAGLQNGLQHGDRLCGWDDVVVSAEADAPSTPERVVRLEGWCPADPVRTPFGARFVVRVACLEEEPGRDKDIEVLAPEPAGDDRTDLPVLAGLRVRVTGVWRVAPSPGNPGETPAADRLWRSGLCGRVKIK